MADSVEEDLSFATLDALLAQALDLGEDELAAFLAALGSQQREALLRLLKNVDEPTLGHIATRAAESIREAVEEGGLRVGNAGDWELKREIGSGGTGQVFYAERREQVTDAADTDRFVQRAAVKILWSHRVRSQFRDRFLRERRILASVDHPGLARFLDGGLLEDGRPWFAMEYVEGVDIVSFTRGLGLNERLSLFAGVVDTIAYAHQRLIVHRDIKPQNILVDPLGQPRVLDFGIARIVGELDEKELTRAQGTPVTLQYASPEQVTGGSVDVASDVYQLGLLLYEILTSSKPYRIDESSLQTAIATICEETPQPPSREEEHVGRDLDAIVDKALRKKPAERYASAAAMADDVRRYLDGRPVSARPQSRWYVCSRFLRRNALPAGAMAVAFLVLIGATVVSIRSANQARDEAERSRTTQRILADVFEQADPFGDGGAEVTLADALIRAKPGIEEKVMDDPRLAWEVNRTLAGIFTNLDLQDLEREAFQAAWDAALELEGANEREVLFGVAGIGNILTRNDPATALTFFAEHLPKLPASPEGAAEWLSAKYAEVSALIRLRDYAGADQGARDMQRVAVEFSVAAPRTLARIDQLLAGAARRAGDVAAADRHWASSVANMQRAATPIGLAVTLSNQALHFGMTGRFAESEAAFQESIAIFREHAPDHTSHANIQRLYAGLLYRMRRPDEALGALRETLSILDPDEESYTYVVAQIARADVAFAKGDTAQTFAAIEQSSDVAVATFSPNSDVTQRILPVLARLLLFAGYPGEAAQAVGVGSGDSCAVEQGALHEIDAAVSRLADNTAAETARQTAWSKVHALEQLAADGNLNANAFSNAADELRAWQSVFIDVLDRYQILNALHDLGQQIAGGVPAGLREERARVSALRRETRGMLAADGRARLDRVLSMLHPGYVKRSC